MSGVTWRLECFRLGRIWSGEARTVADGQAAAIKELRNLGGGLRARLMSVTQTSQLGTRRIWNAREKGRGAYSWEVVAG